MSRSLGRRLDIVRDELAAIEQLLRKRRNPDATYAAGKLYAAQLDLDTASDAVRAVERAARRRGSTR